MSLAHPLLTIAIPTYERFEMLQQTLRCVIEQIRPDVEIVVVDNASKSYDIFATLAQAPEFASVRFYRNLTNNGIDRNVKACLEHAQGQFVWFLSDDDLLYPRAIDYVLELIKNHKDNGSLILNYDVYDKNVNHCLMTGIVQPQPNDASTHFGRLTFLSILILNRRILNESAIHTYADRWLDTLYYHYALGICMGLSFGYSFGTLPIVKFRSCCSTLGGNIQAALSPYLILKEIVESQHPLTPYSSKTFFKNDVEPWVRHTKKLKTMQTSDLIAIAKVFGFSIQLVKIALIFLIPNWLIRLLMKWKAQLHSASKSQTKDDSHKP